jgi:hypothetical protein
MGKRKVYYFPNVQGDGIDPITNEPEKVKEQVLRACKCTHPNCPFYFDLGTDETKIAASKEHESKTKHSVIMEYK